MSESEVEEAFAELINEEKDPQMRALLSLTLAFYLAERAAPKRDP